MKPITLHLGEENQLKFKLQIQGITSNPNETKPRIRFLVIEKGIEDKGILLPAIKEDDGFVTVSFVAESKQFDANKIYEGSIEVLIGNRIFNAAKYDLSFVKEMKIEVESVVVNNKNFIREDEVKREEIEVSTELVDATTKQNTLFDNDFIKEIGTVIPKNAIPQSKQPTDAKAKIRKAITEKLQIKMSDSQIEKLVEVAYKKYQQQNKD